ncbi:unnamed protein product [Linum trigynum]|uniref:Amino acid transporter transmembrane domain-containing protein n=1 Tax=Linum trigynum TaxID=586398 RepID=A0AAV2DKE6_9ROSI
MAEPPQPDSFPESSRERDAGASFVLESKGQWWHAGYHLTTAIVGPMILTLPYAFRGLGWVAGISCLTVMGIVSFYSYYLMALVLDFCEKDGRRHIRFRELAADVLGSGWMFYFVILIQTAINTGITIGTILLAGQCLEIMYAAVSPQGSMELWEFIAIVTAVMVVLAQMPSFHSLRHINLVSLILCFGYTFLVVAACIYAGMSKNAPARDYSLESATSDRVYSAFTSISIIAAIFGIGILPEIQATLLPPASGKMLKGLVMCYSVIVVTNYSVSVSGYFVFGNKSSSNIIQNFMPDNGPDLAPTWILGGAAVCVLFQLFAIGLVYSQVAFEVMEKKSADASEGMFAMRNLIPRIILRSLYMGFCGFVAAMLPFFGDISGVVGAIGFIPLDFILPMLLYNLTYRPSKSSVTYWINMAIMVVFTGVGLLGAFSCVRQLVLDVEMAGTTDEQFTDIAAVVTSAAFPGDM